MFTRKKIKLRDFLSLYAVDRELKFESLRQFSISVELFLDFVKIKKDFYVHQFNEQILSEFVQSYARTVSPTTARNKRTALLALWRAASDAGWCSPPTRRIQRIKIRASIIRAWDVSEVKEIIKECKYLQRYHDSGLKRSAWWELAVRVAWDSALRWGDQINVNYSDIAENGSCAIVQSKTNRIVSFKLSQSTLELARETMADCPRSKLCPWNHSQQTFNDQFRRIVRKSNVNSGTWKFLRRGSATNVEARFPGSGASHLGHVPGSPIAERNYFDQSLLNRSEARPRELF